MMATQTIVAAHTAVLPALTPFTGREGVLLLPHDQNEVERLQKQHQFIKNACNGKLIPAQLLPGSKVLDSGCADGTWLADLNKFHSGNLSAHGIDISDSIFRKNAFLDLKTHDIRKTFPASWGWKDKFDLVHQRWLVWGLRTSEWQAAVHNLADAVKPGGYIQLVEAQWILDDAPKDCPEQKRLNLVQTWACESAGLDIQIESRLESLLRKEGVRDIEVQSFDLGYGAKSGNEEDRFWTAELLLESLRPLALHINENGIPGVAETPEQYFSWLDRLVEEVKNKGYTPKLKWVRGRKASTTKTYEDIFLRW